MNLLITLAVAIFTLIPRGWTAPPMVRALRLLGGVVASSHHLDARPNVSLIKIPISAGTVAPTLGATSGYAIDLDTGKVLYDKNSSEQRPIASITKIITVMVILHSHPMDEVITVPTLPAYTAEDSKVGLRAGQQFRLGDLLAMALIPSANDAADALAISDSGSVPAFCAKMNSLVAAWGIKSTHFASANGLVDSDNYATAQALARLARIALQNPQFVSLTSTAHKAVADLSGQTYDLGTTNQLLADPRFSGVKTGFTAAAGESVVSLATVNGHRVITVILNSPDRFGETTNLVDWIQRNYTWQ